MKIYYCNLIRFYFALLCILIMYQKILYLSILAKKLPTRFTWAHHALVVVA